MRTSTFVAIALSGAVLGSTNGAQAQVSGPAKLFFEGDMVRGGQPGAPGPVCVLNNQFKHLEKVVWRLRILDQNGQALDGSGLKSLVIELPDGQKVKGRSGSSRQPIRMVPSSIRRPPRMRSARPRPGSLSSV